MFPRPDSDFVTLHNSERRPPSEKAGLEPVTALRVPSTLDPWFATNERATGGRRRHVVAGGAVVKLRALLADEKTLIGLANSLGGLLVFLVYVVLA